MGRVAGAELYIALGLLVRCGVGQTQESLIGAWIPSPIQAAATCREMQRVSVLSKCTVAPRSHRKEYDSSTWVTTQKYELMF